MLVEANTVVSPTAEPKQNGVEGPARSLPSFAEGIGAGGGHQICREEQVTSTTANACEL